MSWTIEYSKDADNFLKKHQHAKDILIGEIKKLIQRLNGETVNIKFEKMAGDWKGYYRIRKGEYTDHRLPGFCQRHCVH